ncbi:hypothetical protein JX265_009058 [Neoarthrinium moseri]|uniref:Unsaturated glucuronyl hydrolase n=1 Tax=Neoarthrinium moseri TaxID=1658444 RepID=A0A9P9WH98_9PEZI|nr:uncharacterized protein JN550_011443 [Neoarthrinium moseri]KAI1846639.1 hypothetical protein JX266_007212 [Neoarthrinium moseri]KAI1860595.1 hypothetical protein JN550_011443 [Neoarthrinium moseri]KAI1863012.1 hypothetical protein JX265_009058 [Neoarthrinium moseri]
MFGHAEAGNDQDRNAAISSIRQPDIVEGKTFAVPLLPPVVGRIIGELYEENILAKIVRTATQAAAYLPGRFPESVPQDGPQAGRYNLREAEFWTCGFFPGILYSMLERAIRYPSSLTLEHGGRLPDENGKFECIRKELFGLSKKWAEPLYSMANRTDTHDIGFIIMPALRLDWELLENARSLEAIDRGARSLATRYVPSAKAIRSWDLLQKMDIKITSKDDNLLVIIDSLCNLDLLYYAAAQSADGKALYDIATEHATTILRTHLRPQARQCSIAENSYQGQWYSTCHIANLDPKDGSIKQQITGQGYADDSTWARGQAWAILGYAQTYMWTKEEKFLHAACGCAEYFMYRLETSPACVEVANSDGPKPTKGRYTPLWDFDAPVSDATNVINPLRDSSSGVIAANGLLLISQAMVALGRDALAARFSRAALDVVRDILDFALAPEKATLTYTPENGLEVADVEGGRFFEGILKYGTANNNANAKKRYANHTLVYGDYYLIEFGNRLLRMGIA